MIFDGDFGILIRNRGEITRRGGHEGLRAGARSADVPQGFSVMTDHAALDRSPPRRRRFLCVSGSIRCSAKMLDHRAPFSRRRHCPNRRGAAALPSCSAVGAKKRSRFFSILKANRITSPPSAFLPARSDALLCYLQNTFVVERENRHSIRHREELSITVRFCFRDDLRVMIQENAAETLEEVCG